MKKIRTLKIIFNDQIKSYEIPAFRGAIIKKAGEENIAFHQHLANGEFLYKYPLIQYKQIGKRPAIVCIEYGIDEIHNYFENEIWDIEISNRKLNMDKPIFEPNEFMMQIGDSMFNYSISNWIALNQGNFIEYNQIESLSGKIEFLENKLKGNILSFAKGIEWTIDKRINLIIKDFKYIKDARLKGIKMNSFNIDFATNVFLPNYIGLGKAVSKGYGVVKRINKERVSKNTNKDY